MPHEVYATWPWIGYRVFLHIVFLLPVLVLTGYMTQNCVLVFGLFLILVFLYSALIYGQLNKPLVSIVDGKLVIVNLFRNGVVTLSSNEIEGLSSTGRKFCIEHKSGATSINVVGLSSSDIEQLKVIEGVLRAGKGAS